MIKMLQQLLDNLSKGQYNSLYKREEREKKKKFSPPKLKGLSCLKFQSWIMVM